MICYHPLQTEDELELVNEVIFVPHVGHSHELMVIDCWHGYNTVQEFLIVLVLFHWHVLGWYSAYGSHLTACDSGLVVLLLGLCDRNDNLKKIDLAEFSFELSSQVWSGPLTSSCDATLSMGVSPLGIVVWSNAACSPVTDTHFHFPPKLSDFFFKQSGNTLKAFDS